jgi:hypothetical protein
MKPIEPLRVKPVEVPHHAGEIRLRGAQTDMVVIAHQAIGEYLYSPTIMKLTERIEKSFVVSVFEKNLLPGAATVHHVVDSSGVLNTKRPSHDIWRITSDRQSSTKDLTPAALFILPALAIPALALGFA